MNQRGFTLIELVCVLVILGVLATVAVKKYVDLSSNAEQIALVNAIAELNAREKLAWLDFKLSGDYDKNIDKEIRKVVDTDLGGYFEWNGDTLVFRDTNVALRRIKATESEAGMWVIDGEGGNNGKGKGKKKGWLNPRNPHYAG